MCINAGDEWKTIFKTSGSFFLNGFSLGRHGLFGSLEVRSLGK